jgi:hypothetical protein
MHSIVLNWSIQEKLVYSYCMKNNKAFTLINSGKAFFFFLIAAGDSYQVIINT